MPHVGHPILPDAGHVKFEAPIMFQCRANIRHRLPGHFRLVLWCPMVPKVFCCSQICQLTSSLADFVGSCRENVVGSGPVPSVEGNHVRVVVGSSCQLWQGQR